MKPEKIHQVQCDFCDGSGFIIRINPEWLIAQRKKHGLSLRQVAKDIGISAAYLSDIEHGKRRGNNTILKHYENF